MLTERFPSNEVSVTLLFLLVCLLPSSRVIFLIRCSFCSEKCSMNVIVNVQLTGNHSKCEWCHFSLAVRLHNVYFYFIMLTLMLSKQVVLSKKHCPNA